MTHKIFIFTLVLVLGPAKSKAFPRNGSAIGPGNFLKCFHPAFHRCTKSHTRAITNKPIDKVTQEIIMKLLKVLELVNANGKVRFACRNLHEQES